MVSENVKSEALRRMKYFGLWQPCISAFEKGKVCQSENSGYLYEVDEKIQKIIDDFQQTNEGAVVYHVIKSYMKFGENEPMSLYSFLYVFPDVESWVNDRAVESKGIVYAYVYNETVPEFSEPGFIGIEPNCGGLVRTDREFDYKKYNEQ